MLAGRLVDPVVRSLASTDGVDFCESEANVAAAGLFVKWVLITDWGTAGFHTNRSCRVRKVIQIYVRKV